MPFLQLPLPLTERTVLVEGVVEYVHVQVPIQVVIEKSRLCTEPHEVEPVRGCFVLIVRYAISDALADVELVGALQGQIVPYLTYVDIQ